MHARCGGFAALLGGTWRFGFLSCVNQQAHIGRVRAGTGGTWDGTTENLKRGWSPVFVNADGSESAEALIARGAVPVRTLSGLDELQPAQLRF